MANLHIRDVDEALVRKLHQRARANGRSAAEEHRLILKNALVGGNPPDIHALAAQLRERLRGRHHDQPAEELIREMRNAR